MAFNNLEYAALFQQELDKQVLQEATTGWMELNAGQIKYNGGAEIKIPEIYTQGLGDYDRDDGFVRGVVNFKYQTYKMTQDRGRKFRLDRNDVDETNFGIVAANVMSEFQRTQVIPEIDSYRYSKLAGFADVRKENFTPTAANVFEALKEHIYTLADISGDSSELVVSMSYPVYSILNSSDEISRHIDVADFAQGEANFRVRMLDGVPIIPVTSSRMKTKYVSYDGVSSGQEQGGLAVADDAKDINWIICPRVAPIAVSKTDYMKIISPEVNQSADSWDVFYRKYHELFVPEQKRKVVAVCTK